MTQEDKTSKRFYEDVVIPKMDDIKTKHNLPEAIELTEREKEFIEYREPLREEGQSSPEVTITYALTAVVNIAPQHDQVVQALHDQAVCMVDFANALVIESTEDMKRAVSDLSIIAGIKKAIEEKRKEYTQPIRAHLDAINEAFKTFTEPLLHADKIMKDKMLVYDAEVKRQRQEQENINRLRMEAAQKEMELKGEITESVDLVEVQPEAPKTVHTDMGSAGQRMIKKWELIDISLVPDELKLIDAGKVTRLVKAGIGSIAGIRIYEEPIIAVTNRR